MSDRQRAIGKVIESVSFDSEQGTLFFTDGSSLRLTLDADCCSYSYFTEDALEEAKHLAGEIRAIEDRFNEEDGTHENKYYFLTFVTSKGHVTLDWRNESNGYYGGSVVFRFTEAT